MEYLSSLRDHVMWALWKLEEDRNGRMTKVPYSVSRNGRASSTDPATWCSFTDAETALKRSPDKYNGIALMIPEDSGIVFTDLDHCRSGSGWSDKARHIMELFQYSYMEISQSGEGVHIISCGEIPDSFKNSSEGVEMYYRARFCAMTGNVIGSFDDIYGEDQAALDKVFSKYCKKVPDREMGPARPSYVPSLGELQIVARAQCGKSGRKFTDLYNFGSWGDYFGSQSEADLSLCSMLAFWCNRDFEMIDHIFRSSALYRKKWERSDYREKTIRMAVNGCTECYCEFRAHKAREGFMRYAELFD